MPLICLIFSTLPITLIDHLPLMMLMDEGCRWYLMPLLLAMPVFEFQRFRHDEPLSEYTGHLAEADTPMLPRCRRVDYAFAFAAFWLAGCWIAGCWFLRHMMRWYAHAIVADAITPYWCRSPLDWHFHALSCLFHHFLTFRWYAAIIFHITGLLVDTPPRRFDADDWLDAAIAVGVWDEFLLLTGYYALMLITASFTPRVTPCK